MRIQEAIIEAAKSVPDSVVIYVAWDLWAAPRDEEADPRLSRLVVEFNDSRVIAIPDPKQPAGTMDCARVPDCWVDPGEQPQGQPKPTSVQKRKRKPKG